MILFSDCLIFLSESTFLLGNSLFPVGNAVGQILLAQQIVLASFTLLLDALIFGELI